MFEKRDSRIDLLAMAISVVVVFLTLSLLSYNPADPPVELAAPFNRIYEMRSVTYPVAEHTSNACGRWGALTSGILFDVFGFAAYFLVGSMSALAGMLLLRREIDSLLLRTVGWTAALVGTTALMSMLLPWAPVGSVMGAGGQLGALCGGLLEYHFARVGGFVLAISLLFGGLLLSTDYVLLRLAMITGTLLIAVTADHRRRRGRPEPKRVDRPAVVGGETLAMRLRGKNAVDGVEEEEDDDLEAEEEDDDDFEEEEEEDEELDDEPAPISIKKPISIKRPALVKKAELIKKPNIANLPVAPETNEIHSTISAKMPTGKATATGGAGRRRRLAALRLHKETTEVDRDEVMNRLDEASETEDRIDYELPSIDLLTESGEFCYENQEREVLSKAKLIDKTFKSFGLDVRVVDIEMGPVIAQYELELQVGLRLNKITALADDLAIALRVPSVRIVAPIPGKNTVGIEVPNSERQLVRLREAMEKANGKVKKMGIPLFLGKDVSGAPLTVDLAKLPHLLIAGRTGTGKSVCLNAIISSILMTRRPDEVRMLMIDPKMVELSGYGSLPHLMHPVVTDMRKAEAILAWAVEKMEERYAILARAGVRHMTNYNSLSKEEIMDRLDPQSQEERDAIPLNMPYIVIVADEMADLMMTAGKEVQTHIIRLAQKSRAVGIHLILATQKPTVDVITGLIKSNLPARIAFQVASRTDSRVVLDEMGADKLLGNGDMLFLSPGTSTLIRGQGTYLSDEEIDAIVAKCSTGKQNFVKELVNLKVDDEKSGGTTDLSDRDDLYEQAIEVVIREGRGSISLLQRALGIGYGRAARMVDHMAEDGVVGPYAGSKTRQVVITIDDWHEMKSGASSATNQELASVSPITARSPSTSNAPRSTTKPERGVDINAFVDNLIEADEDSDEAIQSPPPKRSTGTLPAKAISLVTSLSDQVSDALSDEEEDEEHIDDEYEDVEEEEDVDEIDNQLEDDEDEGEVDEDEDEIDAEFDDEDVDEGEDVDDNDVDDNDVDEEVDVDEDDEEQSDDDESDDELAEDEEYEYVYEDVEDEYEEEDSEEDETEDAEYEEEELEDEDAETETV